MAWMITYTVKSNSYLSEFWLWQIDSDSFKATDSVVTYLASEWWKFRGNKTNKTKTVFVLVSPNSVPLCISECNTLLLLSPKSRCLIFRIIFTCFSFIWSAISDPDLLTPIHSFYAEMSHPYSDQVSIPPPALSIAKIHREIIHNSMPNIFQLSHRTLWEPRKMKSKQ